MIGLAHLGIATDLVLHPGDLVEGPAIGRLPARWIWRTMSIVCRTGRGPFGANRIITIRHPDAPEGLRVLEIGRAVSFEGKPLGFQPSPTLGFTGAILGADALRAVAALLDAENSR